LKFGTDVGHVTRDSDTTFKVKRSKVNLQVAGAYCGGLAHSLLCWAEDFRLSITLSSILKAIYPGRPEDQNERHMREHQGGSGTLTPFSVLPHSCPLRLIVVLTPDRADRLQIILHFRQMIENCVWRFL